MTALLKGEDDHKKILSAHDVLTVSVSAAGHRRDGRAGAGCRLRGSEVIDLQRGAGNDQQRGARIISQAVNPARARSAAIARCRT